MEEADKVLTRIDFKSGLLGLQKLNENTKVATANEMRTAAQVAAKTENEELVRTLLKKAASLDEPGKGGTTADPNAAFINLMQRAYLDIAQTKIESIEAALEYLKKARNLSPSQALLINDQNLMSALCQRGASGPVDPSYNAEVSQVCEGAAQTQVRSWQIAEALSSIATARQFAKARLSLENDSRFNNELCWNGSLGDLKIAQAKEVRDACKRAVDLTEDTGYRDSRGVNRARNGDYKQAIEDFQSFLDDADRLKKTANPEEIKKTRLRWISILKEDHDPFTVEELQPMQRGW